VVDLIDLECDVLGDIVADEFEARIAEELLDVRLVAGETVWRARATHSSNESLTMSNESLTMSHRQTNSPKSMQSEVGDRTHCRCR
jgi:hypothetical protein